MTVEAQATEGTPASKDDNKRFELCNCQRAKEGKIHGYFVRGERSKLPVTIVSVRAGKFVLDELTADGDGFITAEEKARMIDQMETSGLPVERDGDIEVAMKMAKVSADPLEMLMAVLNLAADDPSELKQQQ